MVEVEERLTLKEADQTTAITGNPRVNTSAGRLGIAQFLSKVYQGAELFTLHWYNQLYLLHFQNGHVDLYLEIKGQTKGLRREREIGPFFVYTWNREQFLGRFLQSPKKWARVRPLLNQMARDKGAGEKTLNPQEVLERLGLQSFKGLH